MGQCCIWSDACIVGCVESIDVGHFFIASPVRKQQLEIKNQSGTLRPVSESAGPMHAGCSKERRGEETMRRSCRDHAWGRLKWSHWLPPVRPVALRHYPVPLFLSLPPFLHSLLFLVHPRLRASGSWADQWPHATAPPVAWEVGLIATGISTEQCGRPSDRQLTIGVVGRVDRLLIVLAAIR